MINDSGSQPCKYGIIKKNLFGFNTANERYALEIYSCIDSNLTPRIISYSNEDKEITIEYLNRYIELQDNLDFLEIGLIKIGRFMVSLAQTGIQLINKNPSSKQYFNIRKKDFIDELKCSLDNLIVSYQVNSKIISNYSEFIRIFENSDDYLCHGDLSLGNILSLDKEIKIIDFEYSTLGMIEFDITSILSQLILMYCESLRLKSKKNSEIIFKSIEAFLSAFENFKLDYSIIFKGSIFWMAERIYHRNHFRFTSESDCSVVINLFSELLENFQDHDESVNKDSYLETIKNSGIDIFGSDTKNKDKSISLIVKITDKCNMRCDYCYNYQEAKEYDELATADINRLIDLLAEKFKKINIIWHGGEPLLVERDKFLNVIRYQHDKNNTLFSNSIMTNGLLLNIETATFLKDNNFNIGISLDGPYFSGRPQFDKVFENILELKNNDIKFGVICVVNNHNIDNMINIYRFFYKNRIDFQFNPVFMQGNALNFKELKLDSDYYSNKLIEIFEIWLNDDNCRIRIDPIVRYVEMYFGKNNLCTYSSCVGKWISINPNGELFPCGRFYPQEFSLGFINNMNSIDDIFNTLGFDNLISGAIIRREKCKVCEFYNYCNGGCNNDAITHGDISENNFDECKVFLKVFPYIKNKLDSLDKEKIIQKLKR